MWDKNIIAYKRVPQNRPDVTLVLKDKQQYLGNGAGDVAVSDNRNVIGPLQPLHFGPGFVKLVNSTSCLGVTIDNKLSWHSQVDVVKNVPT